MCIVYKRKHKTKYMLNNQCGLVYKKNCHCLVYLYGCIYVVVMNTKWVGKTITSHTHKMNMWMYIQVLCIGDCVKRRMTPLPHGDARHDINIMNEGT